MYDKGQSESYIAGLLTLHSIVGCFNHDVHNALKWCASDFTMNAITLKGAFITTSAARNGRRVLIKYVSECMLPSLIVFEDWEGMEDDDLKRYNEIIGITPEIIHIFMKTQIRHNGGKMRVASHLLHSATSVSKRIINLLMYACEWASVGRLFAYEGQCWVILAGHHKIWFLEAVSCRARDAKLWHGD